MVTLELALLITVCTSLIVTTYGTLASVRRNFNSVWKSGGINRSIVLFPDLLSFHTSSSIHYHEKKKNYQ
ncbi:Uncharacterized protein APZ42_019083 [Daphnia magna]|uniref:Uncharacterized protein n=1 Tax=Daphnia magna TaxID=35525 RepID=A0A164YMK4_9CRUS|nr:Uncharacterized protein APZ42_019083 [Daphnia magna]